MSFHNRLFTVGELRNVVEKVRDDLGGDRVEVSRRRSLGDGTRHAEHRLEPGVLDAVCDLTDENATYTFDFYDRAADRIPGFPDASIDLTSDEKGYVDVVFEARDLARLNRVIGSFVGGARMGDAPDRERRARQEVIAELERDGRKPFTVELNELLSRVERLERVTGAASAELTCFLSYQFNGVSLEYGRQVREFLELLGVRVVTGQGYEPKPVSAKVRERLAENLDLVVVIHVEERKSSWTRDEMAKAQSPGVFLVPLVEEGADFDRGIYGDHEFIPFARGHVGDAFTSLLQAVRYVQRVKAASVAGIDRAGC